jgi:alkylation response protein AidB-like acyl-CoA dehydrogenase
LAPERGPSRSSGERIAVLAHGEPDSGFDRDLVATTADPGSRLTGWKAAIPAGAEADTFLVTAHASDGTLGLFTVPRHADGVSLYPFRAIDGRELADLILEGAPGRRLGNDDATEAVGTALDMGALLSVAEMVGAMDALLGDTLAYLRTRQQFGLPLASFQALQHRAVDMYLAVEETRALVEAAAEDFSSRAVSAAKVVGIRSARRVGRESIQMHGGIGLSEELRVGRLFKRLVALEGAYGDADWHLDHFRRSAA